MESIVGFFTSLLNSSAIATGPLGMVLGVVTKMVSSASSSEADTLIKIEQLSPTAQRMYMVREIMRSSQRIVWTFVLCGLFLYVVLSSVDDTIRQMVVGFCSLVIGFLFVDRARK